MKDKDFDNLFMHKFGQLPGEPASEEGWAKLSQRLDAHDRRYSRWILPALLPICFLLAGGNVFWWRQWRDAAKVPVAEAAVTLLKRDTVVQTTVVYRYDTIYQTLVVAYRGGFPVMQQNAPIATPGKDVAADFLPDTVLASAKTTGRFNPAPPSVGNPPLSGADISISSQDSVKQQFENGDALALGRTIVQKVPVDTSGQLTQMLKESIFDKPDSTFEKLLEQAPPTEKVRSSGVYFARPRLGISLGWGDLMLPTAQNGYVLNAGLRGDIEVARNFRLGAEFGYQRANMKVNDTQMLEQLGVEMPDPGSDFHLVCWETPLPVLIYSLHLRYELPLRSRFTPWLGLGGQWKTHLPTNIDFTFQNSTNDHELHIKEHNPERSTHWQGGLVMLGAEYQLGLRTYLGIEGYLMRRLDDKSSLLGNQLGLKASIYRKF